MFEYIILGILQGVFEWIPVSSEGVVVLASQFLIKDVNPVDIALFLHLGTLFAVLIYFRRDWKEVLILKQKNLFYFLVMASFISLVFGFPIYKIVREIKIGGGLLALVGAGLFFTAFLNRKTSRGSAYCINNLSKKSIGWLAVVSGALQGIAVIPGLSRSGSTIFGLSLAKLEPKEILKVSYMLSAPAVLASIAYLQLKNPGLILQGLPALLFSFLTGMATLHFLIKFSQKINFSKFALIFGILCLIGAVLIL